MSELSELWADLEHASPDQRVVRALIALGVALAAVSLASVSDLSGTQGVPMWLGLVALAAGTVIHPHSLAPALTVTFVVGAWWALADGWHWMLLPAALGVLLVHTASALAASVPARAALPAGTLTLWGRRYAVVAAVTTLVWALARVLGRLGGEGNGAAAGGGALPGVVGLLALVVGLVVLARAWWRSTETSP